MYFKGQCLNFYGKTFNVDSTVIANAIQTGKLQVGKNTDGSFNFEIGTDGILKAKGANISGILNAVSGTFKELNAVDSNGTIKATIGFSPSEGKMYFSGDMQHQGYNYENQRSYRFLTSDLWCRGNFGTNSSNTLYVVGSYGYYYTKGLNNLDRVYISLQSGVSSTGIAYYTIPLYGSGDASGFPVDMVILNSSSSYTYLLIASPGKKVTIINSNDSSPSDSYIFCMGKSISVAGGGVREFYNVGSLYNPIMASNILGNGWMYGAAQDNNWR